MESETSADGKPKELEGESFDELVKYTGGGFVGGLICAGVLDSVGLQQHAIGSWLVRTLAGEGESIFEGIFAIGQRIRGAAGSMAEAYGWGKLIGMIVPWIVDLAARLAGMDVFGVETFFIPFFYAMSDQIGANVSGFVFLRRREGSLRGAISHYLRHPVMMASLAVILLVPLGLFLIRLFGFSPTTQIRTALETIGANLCWLPPLVGWWFDRSKSVAGQSGP